MSTSKFYLLLLFFEAIRILNFFFCKVLKALWESEKLNTASFTSMKTFSWNKWLLESGRQRLLRTEVLDSFVWDRTDNSLLQIGWLPEKTSVTAMGKQWKNSIWRSAWFIEICGPLSLDVLSSFLRFLSPWICLFCWL